MANTNNAKHVFYIIICFIFAQIIASGVTYYIMRKLAEHNVSEPEIITQIVTQIDTVKITETLPAVIKYIIKEKTVFDTVYIETNTNTDIESIVDTIACFSLDIDKDEVKGKIDIEYSYKDKQFDVNLKLINIRETKYITETNTLTDALPLFSLCLSSAYTYIDEVSKAEIQGFCRSNFAVGIGLAIRKKVIITPMINTNNNYSLNITYVF